MDVSPMPKHRKNGHGPGPISKNLPETEGGGDAVADDGLDHWLSRLYMPVLSEPIPPRLLRALSKKPPESD